MHRILTLISKFFPFLKLKALYYRGMYQLMAKAYGQEKEWTFMNYGYIPESGQSLKLEQCDEHNRPYIELYQQLVQDISLQGKRVLEVGCGRGGGCAYLLKYHRPQEMVGLDVSPNAINFCQNRHPLPGLHFVTGSAEALPFPDHSFDVVLNLESSHCYDSQERFFCEVKRILVPNGVFLLADLRMNHEIDYLEKQIGHSGFNIQYKEELTGGVFRSLAQTAMKKSELFSTYKPTGLLGLMAKYFPQTFQQSFKAFAATEGSKIYKQFHEKQRSYLFYRLNF
ncbi:MAG: methyltransferase domain-containing protein [Bdellovibrio sp.]|nr:methyltransferase domain-containing protein [Bdellovibrio sp.]